MNIISRAPLRIGLAGGGTDVSPYCDIHNGAILNSTINLFANALIIPRNDNKIVLRDYNLGIYYNFESKEKIEIIDEVKLQIGVYNHIVKNFVKKKLSCEIITSIDVPTGSGLGTSSTLVVALIGAFAEWLKLPLGEYDIAKLAVQIERNELKMSGGRQDQYAATFGGFNFMEFYGDDSVIVNPLRIKPRVLKELEYHLLLFYTKTKRDSGYIIDNQKKNFLSENKAAIQSSHKLKEISFEMKKAILTSNLLEIGNLLKESWVYKKKLDQGVSSSFLDNIYDVAINSGAIGGKISGAGGGGFMVFYSPIKSKFNLIKNLNEINVLHQKYNFFNKGLETWTSHQY